MKKNPSLLPKLAMVGIIGAIGGGYVLMNSGKLLQKNNQEEIAVPQITQQPWAKENDTYKIVWEHPTSGGNTGKVGFSVKLDKDKIIGVDVNILTTNEKSKEYQENFRNGLSKVVVGKKISELSNIDAIGGASGTTDNFKEAVAALGAQLSI